MRTNKDAAALRNMEQTRRKQNELNRAELREARSKIGKLQKELKGNFFFSLSLPQCSTQKNAGTKARVDTLRKESHRARESVRCMLEKDENNNELIEELEKNLESEEQKSQRSCS